MFTCRNLKSHDTLDFRSFYGFPYDISKNCVLHCINDFSVGHVLPFWERFPFWETSLKCKYSESVEAKKQNQSWSQLSAFFFNKRIPTVRRKSCMDFNFRHPKKAIVSFLPSPGRPGSASFSWGEVLLF